MKKVSLTLFAALVFAFSANAQLKNKQGETILPEAGDWAVGIDAAPALVYFGNMFNNSVGNTINWNFTNGNQAIFGKYFTEDNQAYRIGLRIGFTTQSTKHMVVKDEVATTPSYVEDKATQNDMNIVLSAGKEWRRGHGRLQGFYGADAYLMFGTSSTKFTYGNAFSTTYTNPNSTNWITGSGVTPAIASESAVATRDTKENFGSTFGFGVRAFIGAEYFVLPKMSIGGEFGWGLGLTTQGKSTVTTESWDGTTVQTLETPNRSASQFCIDTDNLGGAIKVMFHF